MKKTDILEKSRQENQNNDERQKQEIKKAWYMGGLIAMSFCIIFAVIAIFQGHSVHPYTAIIFFTLGFINLFAYIKVSKKTYYIMLAIFSILLGIFDMVLVLIQG